ncbi:MAG: DedA family protein/thiosulfate sulfurtransferase GlpE [Burkholderiaceae bacterium]|jgi:membrane protein DedA with SNARE-associated domain/rhodanese-related sulfurtransferase
MRDLIPLLIAHGALIVFLITLAARAGAPVPAAPLLVVAGGVSMAGQMSLVVCLIASVVANVLGDAIWYQAGRWRGHRVMKLLCKISLSPDTCVRQSEGILSKWGGSSLIAAKFLPGISVVAAPMAGALGMSWRRFIAYDIGASLIWTSVFLAVGVAFAGQIVVVLDFMTEFGTIAAVVTAIVLTTMIIYRYLRRRWMLSDRYAPRIAVNELRELIRRGESPIVIDVRSSVAMLQDGRRVPGAIVATLAQLPATALELPRDREVVLYCNCPNEVSALRGVRILADLGHHRARALHGGLDAWLEIESVSPLGQLPAALDQIAMSPIAFGSESAR